jgi:hypothetical protein
MLVLLVFEICSRASLFYRNRFSLPPDQFAGQNYGRYVAVIIHAADFTCVKNGQDKRGRYQSSTRIIKWCRRSESARFMKAVIQKSGLKHTQLSLTVLPTMLGQLFACRTNDLFAFTTGKPKVEQVVLLQSLE